MQIYTTRNFIMLKELAAISLYLFFFSD